MSLIHNEILTPFTLVIPIHMNMPYSEFIELRIHLDFTMITRNYDIIFFFIFENRRMCRFMHLFTSSNCIFICFSVLKFLNEIMIFQRQNIYVQKLLRSKREKKEKVFHTGVFLSYDIYPSSAYLKAIVHYFSYPNFANQIILTV